MTDIQAPQAGALAVFGSTTPHIQADQSAFLVPYNVPTKHMRADFVTAAVVERVSSDIEATQVAALAVCRGRVATPQVRDFTFTLDGHDFYGIRLGDIETLIYDVSTQQWVDWDSFGLPFWRINCAYNWDTAQRLANTYGSSIVAGDDTFGLLWFMDPTQPYDDHTDYLNATQQVEFYRVGMAQTMVPGRQNIPCYAIFLDGDNYGLSGTDFDPFIRLETSDDQGKSWLNHGDITTPIPNGSNGYNWLSLGQMQSPGRLFRFTDNGIMARLDSVEMNDDG